MGKAVTGPPGRAATFLPRGWNPSSRLFEDVVADRELLVIPVAGLVIAAVGLRRRSAS